MAKTYVISDIHGHKEEFEKIKEKIKFSEKDKMYILGDILDRGPKGIEILKEVMATPNMVLILGNHEQLMLEYIKYEDKEDYQGMQNALYGWYSNGGGITHTQYKEEPKESQKRIVKYLKKLEYRKEIEVAGKEYILVHGKPGYDEESTIWGRVDKNTPTMEGKTIIFGHTPTAIYQPEVLPMKVWRQRDGLMGIDCGMASKGKNKKRIWNLACVCLETQKIYYSEEE